MTQVAVASPLRLATETGLDAARRGGNAIDAALATAAMLTVAYPHSCGIGGDLLALVREPDGRVTFVNASGRSFRAVDPDAIRSRYTTMPERGPLSITVPGLVGGWQSLHQHGATLPWADLLTPAQRAAADGVPVSAGLASFIQDVAPSLRGYPDLAAVIAPGGAPLTVGQALQQPALSRSLTAIARDGTAALYDGELSAALCTGLAARGVPIDRQDLREFRASESAPLSIELSGWTVQAGRPNSPAYLVLRLLGMLDAAVKQDADASASPLHRRVTADRLVDAFAMTSDERDAILADPRAMTQDVSGLLTPEALTEFARRVTSGERPDGTSATARHAGDTVAVVAADSEGRSVSLIQSLFDEFGSMVLEPTTGIVMHSRGACFALDPASPNVLEPAKRPMHTLSPVLAERDNERLVVGTRGGYVQPQILTQVFSRLMAGASAQAAVAAPRMTFGAWEHYETPDTVAWEDDLDPDMVRELASYRGPTVTVPSRHYSRMGHAHAIRVASTSTGTTFDTGTDPRADGLPD